MSEFAWAVVVSAVNGSPQPEFAIVVTSVGADYIWRQDGPSSSGLSAERVQRIARAFSDGDALPTTAEGWIRVAGTNLGYNVAAEPGSSPVWT